MKDGTKNEKDGTLEKIYSLRKKILKLIRNRLVMPNTMLQIARERILSIDESDDASKCIHACIVLVEEEFRHFIDKDKA